MARINVEDGEHLVLDEDFDDTEVHPTDHPWAYMYNDDYDEYGFDNKGETKLTF